MERIDIDGDPYLGAIADAAARGEEILLARGGEPVARVGPLTSRSGDPLALAALAELQRAFAPLRSSAETGPDLIRRLRDEGDH